jgi:pimeloyl-ACP methyl ester carboxylesterase
VGGSTTSRPAVARRIDSALGVAEEVEFFGAPQRLFGCRHLPVDRPAGGLGLVVCSPVLCDFGANYRREVALARRLAAAGVPVLRYHPRGCGHSDGARVDLTLATLVADVGTALAHAEERLGVTRLAVLATRFAALAAAAALRDRPGVPLALWEPVTKPGSYFREGLRARAVHRLSAAGPAEEPEAELARQGYLDLLGIPVGRALYETPAEHTLAAELGEAPRPLLLVQLEDTAGLRREYHAVVDARGDVTAGLCPCDESWWFIPDRAAPGDEAVAVTSEWVLSQ